MQIKSEKGESVKQEAKESFEVDIIDEGFTAREVPKTANLRDSQYQT